jgi:hypothetical protein
MQEISILKTVGDKTFINTGLQQGAKKIITKSDTRIQKLTDDKEQQRIF